MLLHLCFILFFIINKINCDINEGVDNNNNNNSTILKNESLILLNDKNENKTDDIEIIQTERIIQPMQSQEIRRNIINSNNTISLNKFDSVIIDNNNSKNNAKLLSDFKPSPHLETYYEFNKFPVPPAFPEAKHVSNLNLDKFPYPQWQEKPPAVTTEQTWYSKIKFPSPSTDNNHPYKFASTSPNILTKPHNYNNNNNPYINNNNNNNNNERIKIDGFSGNSPSVSNNLKINPTINNERPFWENKFDRTRPVDYNSASQKTYYDYGVTDTSNKPYGAMQGNPWKKIIKFLTAFIPIGLLISALTPTVITVTSVNDTQTRSRLEDPSRRIISSLNYFNKLNEEGCEDRILCELLLSASSSKDAERHVQNLLDTFTEHGKIVERADEMKKIFGAVRNQNCQPIICNKIKER